MPTEYEVYSQTLEPFLGCVVCVLKEDADKLAAAAEKASGIGFCVREVEIGKRAIPVQNPLPSPVLVDEVRQLMARHGQDALVTLAWNKGDETINIATAGSGATYSEWAYRFGQYLATIVGCDPKEMVTYEDKRKEHDEANQDRSCGGDGDDRAIQRNAG